MTQPIRNSSRPQFSLRTLIVAVTLCAILLALAAIFGFDLLLGFSGFVLSGGFVLLVAFALTPIARAAAALPYPLALIHTPALYFLLELAFFLFGETIDQPHPTYARSHWVEVALSNFQLTLLSIPFANLLLVAFDGAVQRSRPRDRVYFSRVCNFGAILTCFHARLTLLIGVLLVFSYYAVTVVNHWHQHQFAGLVWPPKRVFVACNFLWGILWLADCLTRPRQGTIVAAIGFLLLTFWVLLPMRFGILRE